MKFKKLLAILSACSLSVMSVPMSTTNVLCTSAEDVAVASVEETENSGSCGENVYWEFDESTDTLTISGTGEMDDYDLYFDVFSPWHEKNIVNVIIEDGVTSIGYEAFYKCKSLKSVIIPDSVTSIGDRAFEDTPWLDEKRAENPLVIVNNILIDGKTCSGDVEIPNSVTSIGDRAFYECSSLTSVTIPDSVTSIGNYAFEDCESLTSVTIPNSVTSIGYFAFSNCESLTSIVIPDSVTSIGDDAFDHCKSLTSVTISDSVTSIGWGVFRYCTVLTSATIPDSVTSIGEEAFYQCKSLKSVIIPDSVTSIGEDAFDGCESLTSVTIPDSVTSIGCYAFDGTPWLDEKRAENPLVIVNNILIDGSTCSGDVEIPKGVTNICDSAFAGCTALTFVTIPDSVTSVGADAFRKCKSLRSVIIPDSVTSIGRKAFYGCESLTSVTIPDSVTSIGYCAFEYCESLTSIIIPDSVTSIGNSAFSDCTGLTSVTIPDIVTSIDGSAFSGCTDLAEIIINNPICKIYDSENTISDTAVIHCYETSTASEYAKKYDRKMVAWERPKLNYDITETEIDNSNIVKKHTVESNLHFSTISNNTSFKRWPDLDILQECKDSKGNLYAVCGKSDFITIVPENAEKETFTIENERFTFGSATIDENDCLYVLWGYSISEENIDTELENETENIVIIKYDLSGNILGQCGIPISTSKAQYPFDAGNASIAVKDDVIGCLFNIKWTNGHQGSEFAGIDRNTMDLVTFSDWEGSHSFGVSLIPTDYGFAAVQKGDATARGINFNSYLVSENNVRGDYLSSNGYTLLFNASGQYGTNANQIDGNDTYLHMGGLAKSATTYAIVGKSERVYSSMAWYGDSDLRTYNYDVFLKITDRTLADTAPDFDGEERVDVETGETVNYNIIWLKECNENEKAGQVKVVTLADRSYCVLWEKFVNDEFDSIRYVITDECGNILRHETGIYGARFSRTSVQPIVDGYTLKWAVADGEHIDFYTVNLNDFSTTPTETKTLLGDANCDGEITIADAATILQYLGNKDLYPLTEQGEINSDVAEPKGISANDALAIQEYDAGKISGFEKN